MLGHCSAGKPASFHDWAKDKKETCGHNSSAVFFGKIYTGTYERSPVVLPDRSQPCFTSQKLRHIDEDRRKERVATAEKRNMQTTSKATSHNTHTPVWPFQSFLAMLVCATVT